MVDDFERYRYLQIRVEDLRELEDLTGTEDFLVGKICIARYGKIYRGNKVHNCQNKGAIGISACPEYKHFQMIMLQPFEKYYIL